MALNQMGEKTGISWTDHTYNPWYGCAKVSAGCKFCYAERDMKKFGKNFSVVQRAKTTFNDPLKWKEPAMVFTCSWSDFFIEEADAWRDVAWAIIRRTPHLTYQILTKRPENIHDRLPHDWGDGWPNVWLGVSAEDQENADVRIPLLLTIPATKYFVSAEPLLGEINLLDAYARVAVDQVIVGGESGPNYRPMDLSWAYSLREQCREAGVAFFMKQDAGLHPGMRGRIPDDLWIQEMPK